MTELEEITKFTNAIKNVGNVLASGPQIASNLAQKAINATTSKLQTSMPPIQQSPNAAAPDKNAQTNQQILKSKEYKTFYTTLNDLIKLANGYMKKAEVDQQKKLNGIIVGLTGILGDINKDPLVNFAKFEELEKQLLAIKTPVQESIQFGNLLNHINEAGIVKKVKDTVAGAKAAKGAEIEDEDGNKIDKKTLKKEVGKAETEAAKNKAVKQQQTKMKTKGAKIDALSGEYVKALAPSIDKILKTLEPLKTQIQVLAKQSGNEIGKKSGPEFDLTQEEGKKAFQQAVTKDPELTTSLKTLGLKAGDIKTYFKTLLDLTNKVANNQQQVQESVLKEEGMDKSQIAMKMYNLVMKAEGNPNDLATLNSIRNHINSLGDEFKEVNPAWEYDKIRNVLDSYINLLKKTMPPQTSDQVLSQTGGEHEEKTPEGTTQAAQNVETTPAATGDLAKDMTEIIKKDVGTTISNTEIMSALQTAKTLGIKFTK